MVPPSTETTGEVMASRISDYDREHINEIMEGHGDWFSAQLLRLLQKADHETHEQVRAGFPDHVQLYEDYLKSWEKE